jgi:hypothetical protein
MPEPHEASRQERPDGAGLKAMVILTGCDVNDDNQNTGHQGHAHKGTLTCSSTEPRYGTSHRRRTPKGGIERKTKVWAVDYELRVTSKLGKGGSLSKAEEII